MKKKLIHFIFNLGRGGAETMMVRVIRELDEYENIVVTLFPLNHFGNELKCDKLVCLNLRSLLALPFAVIRFRRLVRKEKPDLVHTHLFWPTAIARAAVPKSIPVVSTIHAFIASSVEYSHWHIRFLDKLTYRLRRSVVIVVARGALDEYFSFLKLKPYTAYALYTFVDLDRFDFGKSIPKAASDVFRVVTVGALRTQKNHIFLVDAFAGLKEKKIELHIYGTGNLGPALQKRISETGARVVLKGEVNNIEELLPEYDLYVMSSVFEGFSLSVLEAMAMGMPLLLSDINSFREQCEDTAIYYSLKNPADFSEKLLSLSITDAPKLKEQGEKARKRAVGNFGLQQHLDGLRKIYNITLLDKDSTA